MNTTRLPVCVADWETWRPAASFGSLDSGRMNRFQDYFALVPYWQEPRRDGWPWRCRQRRGKTYDRSVRSLSAPCTDAIPSLVPDYIARECAGDQDLRKRVESLLNNDAQTSVADPGIGNRCRMRARKEQGIAGRLRYGQFGIL
jgi:hypothetical protein